MHPSAVNVADALRALGVAGQVRELPEPAPTAATAAAQLGCGVGAIANSLVFSADGAPLLVLTSGEHRVDTGKVAPLGHPQPLRTLVDRELDSYDVVWAAAGHAHTVFPTSFTELVRITGGTPADVAWAVSPGSWWMRAVVVWAPARAAEDLRDMP